MVDPPKLVPEWIAQRRKDRSIWRWSPLGKCWFARFVRDGMYVEVISSLDETKTEEEARIDGARVMGTTDPSRKGDTCLACDLESGSACDCDERLDDGCFRCSPRQHKRPPCPPLCRNYRPSVWERLIGVEHHHG